MSYRLRNVGIAVVLAVLAALLTIFYVTNYKKSVQQGEDLVPVWVASRDIAVGTSGSEVGDRNLLRAVEIAKRSVVPGAISEPEQIDQLVATERIYQGEQITLNRFRPLGEQGIKAQLKGRLRAFDLSGNEHQLLMGTLEEGDHVDFVGSIEVAGVALTKVVLRDLLVLKAPSAGSVESKLGSRPDEAFSAMLAVTDAQAQKLFHVFIHGDWTLQLRPVTDAADSRNTVDGAASVMGLARSGRTR
ncbi:MAG TPA: Flp pilus assembly protein CpaB [Gaiellaceae bacterium]|nr:Flp pilus assembly protein CpaB [Gaiellaceae bacterium]HET8651570.1 Flp pilus assembly protein CpaB [Gaiellaceae bacterium]